MQIAAQTPATGITLLVKPPTLVFLMKPDLYVSEFCLNPATPVQGSPVHVRVGVYNQGSAKGGRILKCNFTFSSWFPPPKTTRVIVATENTVNESDEANNTAEYPISVSKP